MAASLAANIEARFAITPIMIEGHNGIFEVYINNETAYTNHSECSVLPTDEEIFGKIEKFAPTVNSTAKSGKKPEKTKLPDFCEWKKVSDKE